MPTASRCVEILRDWVAQLKNMLCELSAERMARELRLEFADICEGDSAFLLTDYLSHRLSGKKYNIRAKDNTNRYNEPGRMRWAFNVGRRKE